MKFNLQVKAFVAFAVMMATGVPQYAGASEVKFCYGNYKGVTRDFGTQRADNYDVAIHVKQEVEGRGAASVTIKGESLRAGMYVYALVVDGEAIDSKRMILTD